jgi:hypothetical protein
MPHESYTASGISFFLVHCASSYGCLISHTSADGKCVGVPGEPLKVPVNAAFALSMRLMGTSSSTSQGRCTGLHLTLCTQ